ncbi:hypothetical protein T10_6252 [Trichinella papuae]|uniref:Uncharacterized protein n=1 Tax=Trichinella papuae TaxID=268474 RepID=A0A0V1N7I4_9BILA|nr:hypothetical protein T10_6252 [Trichinella papuae]
MHFEVKILIFHCYNTFFGIPVLLHQPALSDDIAFVLFHRQYGKTELPLRVHSTTLDNCKKQNIAQYTE